MSAATSRYEDTAAIDFVNYVQADAVKAALVGTPQESLPVLSIAAPFNKAAAIPAGEVTVRDVAGLYIYDNTLIGITLTGAQVKDYLEQSADYFKQSRAPAVHARPAANAVTPTAPNARRTTTTTSWAASTPTSPTPSTSRRRPAHAS